MKISIPVLAALVLTSSGCGSKAHDASNTKIVGGENVSESDLVVRSTVALVSPDGRQFCTGTLITSQHVVTAAHCLRGYRDTLYLAFGTKALLGHFTRDKLRTASDYVVHPEFNEYAIIFDLKDTPVNDIALVKLSQSAPKGSQPVPVMRTHNSVKLKETLTLAGFGLQAYYHDGGGVLAKVDTFVSALRSKAKELDFGPSPGKSACMGDSGGPAFVHRGGRLALVGVTSRGSSYCDGEGTYTDIRYFVDWIISEL